MRKQNLPFKRLATDNAMEQIAADLKYPDLDALYVAIGRDVSRRNRSWRGFQRLIRTSNEDVTDDVPLARPVRIKPRPDHVAQGVMVKGLPDVWVRLGRCCTRYPVATA